MASRDRSGEILAAIPSGEPPPRVLVVDDDEQLARAIHRLLTHMGFSVEVATDGRIALERLKSLTVDVIVLDLRMANLDGLAVLRALRGSRNPPATILHSAHLDVQTAVRAMREGVTDVLEKPVSPSVLADRIRMYARKSRAHTPAIVEGSSLERLTGESAAIRLVREQIRRVAAFTEVPVLIEGPTGSGKELVAEAVHDEARPSEPFVRVACSAVPPAVLETELFGQELVAGPSPRAARLGLLEEAGGGTVFLDDVGELPLALQAKLLRVLESRELRPVGASRERPFRARLVTASARPLLEQIGKTFRTDLYFRLAGFNISMPPLSARLEDIPVLCRVFLERFGALYRGGPMVLDEAAIPRLSAYSWPGNVRELKSAVENAAVMAPDRTVRVEDVERVLASKQAGEGTAAPVADGERRTGASEPVAFSALTDLERSLILKAYHDADGNLSRASRALGIPRSTLRDKLKKYGER